MCLDLIVVSTKGENAMKRLLSLAMSLIVITVGVLLLCCEGTIETHAYQVGDFVCSAGGGTVAIVEYVGSSDSVSIPTTVGSNPVKYIDSEAFANSTFIKSISLPSSLNSVGKGLFSGCSELDRINVYGVSNYRSEGNCLIDNRTNTIVAGCKSSVIPDDGSVTAICDFAFSNLSTLTSISIPATVTSISSRAFYECENVTSITVDPNNPVYYSIDNCLIERDSKTLVLAANNCVIPDDGSIEHIGEYAYWKSSEIVELDIPDGVTSIGDFAFYGCTSLASADIPDGMTSIGNSAFYGCTSLASVDIPSSVTSIGNSAFYGCTAFASIDIPDGVTSIGSYAFADCRGVESITVDENNTSYHSSNNCLVETQTKRLILGCENSVIPNDGSVTSIGGYAFYRCIDLAEIEIPSYITSVGYKAFYGCSKLEKVYYNAVCATDGSSSNAVFELAGESSSAFTIIIGKDVECIPSNCFKNNNVMNVLFEQGSVCESIGNYAFYGCTALTSVDIPSSVKSIGDSAFSGCTTLASANIRQGMTSIGEYAFSRCKNITSITVPNTVKSIGYCAFYGCSSLESIVLPFVGDSAKTPSDTYQYPFGYIFGSGDGIAAKQYYYGSSTTSTTYSTYYIPSSLTSVTITGGNILYGAFYNCSSLKSITLLDSVTTIGGCAFYGCTGLNDISIPSSMTSIGVSAFDGCDSIDNVYYGGTMLQWLMLNNRPNSKNVVFTYSIATDAFYYAIMGNSVKIVGCADGAETINIPSVIDGCSVTGIGDRAFYNCTKLKNVTIPLSVKTIALGAFSGCSSLESITVPFVGGSCDSADTFGYIFGTTAYEGGAETKQYYDSGAFNVYCIPASLRSVTVTGGDIPYGAFDGCKGLTGIVISENTSSIGNCAFRNCVGIASISIPKSVKAIGKYAFSGCRGLESISIPEGVTSVGDEAFYGCSSLVSVSIPTTVSAIGSKVFYNCTAIESLSLHEGITAIGDYAFYNCKLLTEISIPSDVTAIGAGAFRGLASITEIRIPVGVVSIGNGAFQGCTKLAHTYFCGTAEQWAAIEVGDNNAQLEATLSYHKLEQFSGKAPTCTEGGWSEYGICTLCDHSTYSELKALGHDEIPHDGIAPTCTDIGYADYVTCSRCAFTTYDAIGALGHDKIAHEGRAPTCNQSGHADYITCSRCDYTTYVELPAVGEHSWSLWTVIFAPTENMVGFTSRQCETCSSLEYNRVAFASGDIDGDGVLTNSDITLALRSMSGWGVDADLPMVDANYDGVITNRDIIAIIQKLAGWNN